MTTVWITKYALSTGMFSAETEDDINILKDGIVKVIDSQALNKHRLYFQNDWHATKEGAIVRVKEMRDKKIIALEKQIKKLRNLELK